MLEKYIKLNQITPIKKYIQTQQGELPRLKYFNLIQYAAFYGQSDVCMLLINCGAVLDEPYTISPVFFAIEQGHLETAKLLIACGAKKSIAIEHAKKHGEEHHVTLINDIDIDPCLYLFIALIKKYDLVFDKLFDTNPINIWMPKAWQLLCVAIYQNNSKEIISKLIKAYDSSVEKDNLDVRTPLYWAAEHNMTDTMDDLIKKKVNCQLALQQAFIDNKSNIIERLQTVCSDLKLQLKKPFEIDLFSLAQQGSNIVLSYFSQDEINQGFLKAINTHQYLAALTFSKTGLDFSNCPELIKEYSYIVTTFCPDMHDILKSTTVKNSFNDNEYLTLSELTSLTQYGIVHSNKLLIKQLQIHEEFQSVVVKILYSATRQGEIELLTNLQHIDEDIFKQAILSVLSLATKKDKSGIINTLKSYGFIIDQQVLTNTFLSDFEKLPNEVLQNILEFGGHSLLPILLTLSKNSYNNIQFGDSTQLFLKNYDLVLLNRLQELLIQNQYQPNRASSLRLIKLSISFILLLVPLGIFTLGGAYINQGRISGNELYNECISARDRDGRRNCNGCDYRGCACGFFGCGEIAFNSFCTFFGFGPNHYNCEDKSIFEKLNPLWSETSKNYSIGFPVLIVGSFLTLALFVVLLSLPNRFFDREINIVKVIINSESKELLKKLQKYEILKEMKDGINLSRCNELVDSIKTEIKCYTKQVERKNQISFFTAKQDAIKNIKVNEELLIDVELDENNEIEERLFNNIN